MACPTSALVVTAGGVPANLGTTVQVVGVGGVFGSATSTSGTVTLSRTGMPSRVVPQQQVTWSPTAVSFAVPSDLPVSAGDTTWEVRLQATGSPDVCGPYSLTVRAVPVLLFVPPTCVSERRLDVAAIGIGSQAQVRFYDRFDKLIPHNLPVQQRTPTGIACQVPTLRELMASSDFDVDQLTMLLYVRVHDPASGVETPKNELHRTIVALPPPAMGPLAGTTAPDRLIFGDAPRPPELGDQLSLEWVGAPERGRVTFHPLDPTLLESVATIHREVGASLDIQDPDLTVPLATRNRATALRSAGTVGQVVEWTEERIEVVKPSSWRGGVVLIWRDDLPTMPLVIPEIPLPDLCNVAVLRAAVNEVLRLTAASTQLQPGQALQASLLPAAPQGLSAVGQALRDYVMNGVASLAFTYRILGGMPFSGPTTGTFTGSLSQAVPIPANLLAMPNLVKYDADPATAVSSFTVTVDVTVSGIPGCTGGTTVTLTGPTIAQLPIRLPTVAAFFDLRGYPGTADAWGGDGLICVHPGTSLVNGSFDRNNLGGVGAARAAVLAPLKAARTALTALSAAFAANPAVTVPGASSLGWLGTFVDLIEARAADKLVITDEASRGRLTYNPGWWNKASSMFMIGVPDGATTLQLFLGDDFTDHRCDFRMPAGFIVASYWTLHESAFRDPDRNSFSSPPVIPDPGVLQDGRSNAYPWGAFGNMAKSFRWV